jgi:transcription elongation GreA/GreB family factor
MALKRPQVLTAEGKRELEGRLSFLKSVKRPEIAKKIGQAADDGDLSENGAYHQAKEDQGRLEGQIAELEAILRHAEVAPDTGDFAGIGKHVTVRDESGGKPVPRLHLGPVTDWLSPHGQASGRHGECEYTRAGEDIDDRRSEMTRRL